MKLFSQEVKDMNELSEVLKNYKNVPKEYEVAVIVCAFDKENKIIFQRRGLGCRDEQLKLETIGGRVKKSDIDFRTALQREILEEVGTDADIELEEFIISTYCETFDVRNNKEQNWIYLLYKGNFKGGELKIAEPNKCLGYERYKIGEVDENELSNGAKELYNIVSEKYGKKCNMQNNYFIFHGSYGNPYKNWIPWLKAQLSKRKFNCIVPSFTTPYKQDYQSWSAILMAYAKIGYITEETTFITHSLGGIFISKFLIEHGIKVKKIITVAGFNNIQFDEDNSLYDSFYMQDNELVKISELCNEIICFYSDNDPYVPMEKAELFAKNINAKKVLINNAGHFNEKHGYKEFKEIIEYI